MQFFYICRPVQQYLDDLKPLFHIDYLLPRTLLSVMSLQHVEKIFASVVVPPDACLANICYFVKTEESLTEKVVMFYFYRASISSVSSCWCVCLFVCLFCCPYHIGIFYKATELITGQSLYTVCRDSSPHYLIFYSSWASCCSLVVPILSTALQYDSTNQGESRYVTPAWKIAHGRFLFSICHLTFEGSKKPHLYTVPLIRVCRPWPTQSLILACIDDAGGYL